MNINDQSFIKTESNCTKRWLDNFLWGYAASFRKSDTGATSSGGRSCLLRLRQRRSPAQRRDLTFCCMAGAGPCPGSPQSVSSGFKKHSKRGRSHENRARVLHEVGDQPLWVQYGNTCVSVQVRLSSSWLISPRSYLRTCSIFLIHFSE